MNKTTIIINNRITLDATDLPDQVIQKLQERLTFANPKHLENEKYGRWNGDTPHELCFLENDGDSLIIPRGFIRQLLRILNGSGTVYDINDRTRFLPDVDFAFNGRLHNYQAEAVQKITSRRYSVLQAPTGSGKTIIALSVIAKRKQPSLIIVHGKEFMQQWQPRINQFLGIPMDEIGLIGDGNITIGAKVTVAIVNSLKKCAYEIKGKVGFLIVDEVHRAPSTTFTEVIQAFDCAYQLGLSATPFRRDGLTKLIYFYIGDKIHEISTRDLQRQNQIMTATLRIRKTDFSFFYNDNYAEMIDELTRDYTRNELIISDVVNQIADGTGIALVISERKNHCHTLYDMLRARNVEARILTGDVKNGKRKDIVAELGQGHV